MALFCFISKPSELEPPLMEVPQQAPGLPQKGLEAAVGCTMPCMDGGVLRHEVGFAGGAHLLGQVGILHIHEVVLNSFITEDTQAGIMPKSSPHTNIRVDCVN